jgi:hypothetical protein
MQHLTEILILLPLMVICFQVYAFTVSRSGVEKQSRCQILGIMYMVIGVVTFVFHKLLFVLTGFVLIMMGLRLIAHGLDRIDKKIYIDRYNEKR